MESVNREVWPAKARIREGESYLSIATVCWPKGSMAQHAMSTLTERDTLKPDAQLTDTH